MGQRNYLFDAKMLAADGVAAMTASGIGQVASANAIIDFGGPLTRTDIPLGVGSLNRMDLACVIDVTALVVTTNDDVYTIWAMGSNNADGSAPVVLGGIQLGHTTVLPNGASTSTTGRYELFFTTEQNNNNYEYVYLYATVVGTGKSITFRAFFAVLNDGD